PTLFRSAPILWSNSRLFKLRPNHSDICDAARGNPHLFAIQNIPVAVFACAGPHTPWIGSEIGFSEPEAAQLFSRGHLREPGIFLLIGPKGMDGIHNKRGLHADEAANAGISTFKLLHQQSILDIVHARAAIAFERRAVEAEFAHRTHQFARETTFAVALLNDPDEIVLNKPARAGPDDQFVI